MAFLLLKGIPSLAGQNQAPQADPDDFVDRLNYRYTVILLNVFSALVTNRQFSSKQIQCQYIYFFMNYLLENNVKN
jgi:hypothetical protein